MLVTFRQRIKIGWAVVIAIAGVTFAGAVNAGASAPLSQPSVAQSTVHQDSIRSVVRLLDPYVVRTPAGTLALNAPQAVTRKIASTTMHEIESGLAFVNGEILAGRLAATSDHRLYDPKARDLSVQGGWTGLNWYWWGFDMWLSEFYTQKLLAALATGAGVFALCLAIPAVANDFACAALAGIVAVIGGLIWFIDNGNGVVFEYYYWGQGTFFAQ